LASTLATAGPQATDGTKTASVASSYVFATIDLQNSKGIFGLTGITGISDDGRLVGSFADSSGDPFILENGKRTSLRCAPRSVTARRAINNRGNIAGSCSTTGANGGIQGFLRYSDGKVVLLDVPGSNLTEAVGMNEFDQVVGDFRDSSDNQYHGFIWDKGRF